MDDLPDELLLHVFSYIEDGVTLLDAVPLVCKRWLSLSRDPRAWASVRVTVQSCEHSDEEVNDDDEGHRLLADAARVILHAPALRSVSLVWSLRPGFLGYEVLIDYSTRPRPLDCPLERSMTLSALRRCTATVREIHLPEPKYSLFQVEDPLERLHSDDLAVLVDFIECSGDDELRALSLGLLLYTNTFEPAMASWQRRLQAEESLSVDVLLQRPGLEELSLWTRSGRHPYNGELHAELPGLRKLSVTCDLSSGHPMDWFETGVANLVMDLLRGAAGSLQHLHMKYESAFVPYPPAVLEAVSDCLELRSLRIRGVLITDITDMVRNLEHLHTLDLIICDDDDDLHYVDDDDEEDDEEEETWRTRRELYASCIHILQHSDPLAGLRDLRFDIIPTQDGLELRKLDAELFKALGEAAAGATRLELGEEFTSTFPKLAGEMLESMPRLQHVKIWALWCGADDLHRLFELTDLKWVRARVKCAKKARKGFKRAIKVFKQYRPQVRVFLKASSI